MIISKPLFNIAVSNFLLDNKLEERTDENGQIIICTGYYEWNDGTIRNEQESMTVSEDELFSDEEDTLVNISISNEVV